MSSGERMDRVIGYHAYQEIERTLRPVCQRVEAAGSLRRESATIGDLEIVCIPKPLKDLFGTEIWSSDPIERELRRAGFDEFTMNGPLYKKFFFVAYRIHIDLFITTPAQWGVIFLLRTGPAEFSRKIVTRRNKGGLMPSRMSIHEGRCWTKDPMPLETPEEEDAFRAMGLAWIEPKERR